MEQFQQVQSLAQTFNWHSPSWDLFIILFWLVGSVIYAFAAGRGRIMSILVSTYMAKLLVLEAPFLSDELGRRLPGAANNLQQLATFVLLFLILFIFLSRYAFRTAIDSKHLTAVPFTLLFSVLQVGLLINIVLSLAPEATRNSVHPLLQYIFLQPGAGFIWLVLPVVFLIILGKFISDRQDF